MYENLNKAIELDPNSGFVHYVSAMVNGWPAWNWEKCEQEFLKVLEKNPNDAFAHMYYAHLLACLRRGEEALSHCRIALDLDPLNPMIQALSTMVLAGDEEKALYWYEKGYEAHHPMMPYIATVLGSGGPFKIDDPGFDSLLIKMNIPLE